VIPEVFGKITLVFSEKVDSLSLIGATFSSQPNLTISYREINDNRVDTMTIYFTTPLLTGNIYQYTLSGFSDCSGNSGSYTGFFVLPQTPKKGDLIINEILFNPPTGGSDFVEVYNHSKKYISL